MREREMTIIMRCLLFLLPLILSSLSVCSQESCSSNLQRRELSVFNITSLSCLSVWSDQNFILRYKQTSQGLWTFVLSAPNPNSWVGIGFSMTGRMSGASSIVGWQPESGGAGVIKQYYLSGYSAGDVLPDQGNLNLTNPTIVSKSSRIYLVFRLKTDTPPSGMIYAVGPDGAIPSSSNFVLKEHVSFTSTKLDYAAGQSTAGGSPSPLLRTGHGAVNLVAWAIIIPIGITGARYFKRWDPAWFYAHIALQIAGFGLAIVGIVTGLRLEDQAASDVGQHKVLGLAALVMACLQVTALLVRPDKLSKCRKYWNWYHHWVGRLAIVIGIGNTFYGISVGQEGDSWYAGLVVPLIILGIASMILEKKCIRN